MFREEMKKLFVKQHGLVVMILLFIGEMFFTSIIYPKNEPASEYSQSVLNEYMADFSGELTADKTEKILAEQELVLDALNAESELETRLYKGEFSNRNEFRAQYDEVHSIATRSEALEALLEKYYYALGNTKNRFILSGCYDGLGRDYPDVLMLAAIIIITAVSFLNEESSDVSTLIRTTENGRKNAFKAKISALVSFICACQLLQTICELSVMTSRAESGELLFPVQSIPLFRNCPYNFSIAHCFFAISAMRLLGYFFVASLVMLLAVKIKAPLFTVLIPCSICLLQQFAFEPAALAYCVPTGLLRSSGYLRGELSGGSGTDTNSADVPIVLLIIVIISAIIFIAISVITANKYYSCKRRSFKRKTAVLTVAFIFICFTLSGCSRTEENSVVYNQGDNFFFAQNDDYCFISDINGITRIGKSDGSKFQIIRDPFLSKAGVYGMSVCGNDLLCLDTFGSKNISVISLETLSESVLNTEKLSEYSVNSAFTNGKSLFFSTFDENGIYEFRNNKIRKIIPEKIYNNQLCFDGINIFYVNSMLEFFCYDTRIAEQTLLSEDFVRAVYYDGKHVVYSSDKGIFALDNKTHSVTILSEAVAEKLASDGDNIVFLNDGKLFYLGDKITRIYENEPLYFALVSQTGQVILRQFESATNTNVDIFIDIPVGSAGSVL